MAVMTKDCCTPRKKRPERLTLRATSKHIAASIPYSCAFFYRSAVS